MKHKNLILAVTLAAAVLGLSACGTVDASYQASKGIGKSAIGGVGSIVGNSTSDVGRTFGIATAAAGTLMTGAGKVLGGSLDVAGNLVKGTSDVVTTSAEPEKK